MQSNVYYAGFRQFWLDRRQNNIPGTCGIDVGLPRLAVVVMRLTGDGHESSSTVARRLARRRTAAVLYVAFHSAVCAELKNGPHALFHDMISRINRGKTSIQI